MTTATPTTTTEITKLIPKRPTALSWMDSGQGVVDHGYTNYRTFTVLGREVEVVKQTKNVRRYIGSGPRRGQWGNVKTTKWTAIVDGKSVRVGLGEGTYRFLRLQIAKHIARLIRSEAS